MLVLVLALSPLLLLIPSLIQNFTHKLQQMPTASIPSSTGGQRQVPLDVENYPLAPEGLHLEQVHVYIRHGELPFQRNINSTSLDLGERAPVGLRLNTPAAGLPEHWQFCTIGRDFRTAVSLVQQQAQHELPGQAMATSSSERMSLHVRREVERKDGTSVDGEWLVLLTAYLLQFFSDFFSFCISCRST